MVLQTVILPSDICEEEELFFRVRGSRNETGVVSCMKNILYMKKGAKVTTDTYMNIFDAAQWETYTEISENNWKVHICYQGDANIRLMRFKQYFYLYLEALSDVIIYFIHYESNVEAMHAGNEAGAHHLYLSTQDAVNEEPGTDL